MKHKQQVVLADGIVVEVLDAQSKVRVRIPDQNLVTKPLPVLVPYANGRKAYALPALDTHCKILLDASGNEGVVLGYFYDEKVTPPVSDRAIIHHEFPGDHLFQFNQTTGVLTINCTRIEINAEQGMHIDNNQESTINSRAIAVIGAMDSDNEANAADELITSGQL